MKEKLNQNFWPMLVLVVVCFVSTALLAITNEITWAAREEQVRIAELASKNKVFPAAASFTELTVPPEYEDCIQALEVAESVEGTELGYLMLAVNKGYGGPVPVYLGISTEGEIVGIDLPSNNETPGLGQKVRDAIFYEQFPQQNASQRFTLSGGGANLIVVDAVAGATTSSAAVVDSVNTALDLFQTLDKE